MGQTDDRCRLLKQQIEEEVERVKTAEAALSKEWAKASSSRGQGRAEALAPRAPRSEQEQRQLKELQWAMATQAAMQRAQQWTGAPLKESKIKKVPSGLNSPWS